MAQLLVSAYGTTNDIIIRPANEFNGTWFTYSVAAGQEAAFVQAWHQYVDTFRSVSSNFKFEWNLALGFQGPDLAKSYPGDNYVDYVGMDFYYDKNSDSSDPVKAWNQKVNPPGGAPGLQWLETFAAAHGKQTAYSEWGANTDNAGPYITLAAQWFATHDVAYQIYWDSNTDPAMQSQLDNGQYPTAAAAYLAAFGATAAAAPIDTSYALDANQSPATWSATVATTSSRVPVAPALSKAAPATTP